MNRREFLYLGPGVYALRSPAADPLSRESREPIPEPHFPNRLYQFVWRNWELANSDRMAAVIRASPEAVVDLGSSMGLPKKRHLIDDQLARLYITVIRQNWHLLPESQIIELLGWDRQKFDFILKEDDFLDFKLGTKPRCDELTYQPPSQREKSAAEGIRRTVLESFGRAIDRPGEDLFAFVTDLSKTLYVPARDPAAKPHEDEIDLSRDWAISAGGSLEPAAFRFANWLQSVMNAEIVAGTGLKTIRLEVSPGVPGGREAFRIEVNEREVRILGNDDAGVLQGIYLLEDLMEVRDGPFLRRGTIERKTVWNPRYLYSYFALYGDPLIDTERDPFPDAYLEKLARSGINGVWMQAVLNTLAPSL
ncbi:MAG TPA: glycoside hydrolase family 20 zincin-like fold domain-containing protein, partial [Bryobacteraceae bacterium]|nr:glycoside hydrolase family 20 zincin-like fold domain-containing protein [Bryobacteraceae bacterium]